VSRVNWARAAQVIRTSARAPATLWRRVIHAGVVDDLSYISAAGGAFLEWLEGKTLPGVAVLEVED